ncbi:hypothetical protein KKA87_06485 [bacterium]|nr:hypothetical protein [bacterium]
MKITLTNRLQLLQIIPPMGNYKEVLLARGLVDKIKISDKEEKDYKFEHNEKGVRPGDKFKDKEFEIDFSEEEIALLKTSFERLESMGQIDIGNVGLYEKFVL